MMKLSVNINKIATIRNARGGNTPNLLLAASRIESFGADGITVHPRPDERHIRYADVRDLKAQVQTELNVEGYPNGSFMNLVLEVVPHQVTLVPDPPEALTSNAGWDIETNFNFLSGVIRQLKDAGIRTSIFVEANIQHMQAAKDSGVDRIELYTESFAVGYHEGNKKAIEPFVQAAYKARELGLGVNAGHDLNLDNLAYFAQEIPILDEVSIGHALISDALYYGLENTVRMYKQALSITK
ncbi:MAG: pyridoxine 5'-phosphate synthase [Bacteroidetes bacterium]|nr:pyridoxine 5'-phosphate synthase [Bacteroidota bacterium]